ncbi:MAG TPA: hypothetical protein VH092_23710 [Urbifossiella sp.]|nr:hypothetical protein [Urbifossiella sp.]
MKRLLLILPLAACSPQPCPSVAVKTWSPAEQRQILAAEQKLPADSILILVLEDYGRLRREVR